MPMTVTPHGLVREHNPIMEQEYNSAVATTALDHKKQTGSWQQVG